MVHLIGFTYSTCTQRVLTVLAEKGVTDFTTYTPDMRKGEHKQSPHIDKQPFGVIPVLEDGDFTLYESRAIGYYLAAKYDDQGTKLIPDKNDLKANALFQQWMSVEVQDWDRYAAPLVLHKLFRKLHGMDAIPEIVDDALAKFNASLDVFDIILGKQKYMAGDQFSLVDIFYLPNTQKLFEIGEEKLITSRPNVKAWWERVSTRESWKQVYAPMPVM